MKLRLRKYLRFCGRAEKRSTFSFAFGSGTVAMNDLIGLQIQMLLVLGGFESFISYNIDVIILKKI